MAHPIIEMTAYKLAAVPGHVECISKLVDKPVEMVLPVGTRVSPSETVVISDIGCPVCGLPFVKDGLQRRAKMTAKVVGYVLSQGVFDCPERVQPEPEREPEPEPPQQGEPETLETEVARLRAENANMKRVLYDVLAICREEKEGRPEKYDI